MELTTERLVKLLLKMGEDRHMTKTELGMTLGFTKDRAKNIFSERTKLSGDDVLQILSNPDYSLPKLRRYMTYWNLQEEISDVEQRHQIIDAANEDAMMFTQPIQSSLMQTNVCKPLSEAARDVMADKEWWILRTGWICSTEIEDEQRSFRPIAPDFLTALRAMTRLGWIEYNKTMHATNIYWNRLNNDKTGHEAKEYCENELRRYIISHKEELDVDPHFMRMVTGNRIGTVEKNRVQELEDSLRAVETMTKNWTAYTLPTEPNEYGVSPADIYDDKFNYLEAVVLNMIAIHDGLMEEQIEIPEEDEQRYRQILSKDGERYRYAFLIDPILAVDDRRGHLAAPTPEDWETYERLQGRTLKTRTDKPSHG
ncbi:hypothetical protein [Bifidobacterium cuniculi]|uniref:Uncharacterized protein n=1 Tax=Bifidobacterium cuniculi TaxID=1688 RepID=A0A087AZJ3_9BIFI|nr:hypothetical protein [Bifidobacterium cuniculi]KFI64193.1 hypothetical protein BCUN_2054 [Bifidobacterium cuniculi]